MLTSLRRGLIGLTLGAALALGAGSGLEQVVADTPVAAKQTRSKADSLWTSGKKKEAITEYMKLSRVEDILGDSVQYVQYNAEKNATNFDKLVYQANEKVKKPVMVLFYGAEARDPKNYPAIKRDAIIFRDLVRQYGKSVRFLAYEGANEKIKPWSNMVRTKLADFKRASVVAGPSIALYNVFDIAKGETPTKNDGMIKKIDIMQGGPKHIKQITQWANDFPIWWINPNLFYKATPDKDGKLYRMMNTGDYKVVPKVNFRP